MSTGLVGWAGLIFMLLLALMFIYLTKRFTPREIRELVGIINTKGGNILLLAVMSLIFFISSMTFFYYTLSLIVAKQIAPDNAVLLMGVQFATSSAFGGSFGALVAILSGEVRHIEQRQVDRKPPPPTTTEPVPPGGING
jgi:hypothetical protein